MASPYGGYSPPSFGAYNGINNMQGYGPQNMQNPYAQRLQSYEQQYPQYGQTVPPPPQQTQPPQNMGPSETLISVGSLDDARGYIPDMSGNKQIFSIASNPAQLAVKQFNISDGSTSFDVFEKIGLAATLSENEAQNQPVSNETKLIEPITQDDIQPIRCQISGLEETCIKIMDKFDRLEDYIDGKLSKLSADDGAKQPTGRTNVTAGTANDADGGKSPGNTKSAVAAKSKQSNAATAPKQEPSGD